MYRIYLIPFALKGEFIKVKTDELKEIAKKEAEKELEDVKIKLEEDRKQIENGLGVKLSMI